MSNNSLINLSKDLGIVLEKKRIPNVVVQVGAVFDVSGSTKNMYERGVIQRAMDRIFALAYKFDDNQVLDSWAFANQATELEPIVESMFGNYVNKYVLENRNVDLWGGTEYLGAMEMVMDHYFGDKVDVAPGPQGLPGAMGHVGPQGPLSDVVAALSGFIKGVFGGKSKATPIVPATSSALTVGSDPAYIAFVTDGENSSAERNQINQLISNNQDKPIFWNFIGISEGKSPSFDFLQQLASRYPNVAFFDAGAIDNLSNNELYTNLVSDKFVSWYSTTVGA